ncbi:hypothetical protein [Nocardia asteroides]|uniref:hypothetical protein n=1 Tax=Nocardia asteroides TaxID=1824 RepID=UPI0034357781
MPVVEHRITQHLPQQAGTFTERDGGKVVFGRVVDIRARSATGSTVTDLAWLFAIAIVLCCRRPTTEQ